MPLPKPPSKKNDRIDAKALQAAPGASRKSPSPTPAEVPPQLPAAANLQTTSTAAHAAAPKPAASRASRKTAGEGLAQPTSPAARLGGSEAAPAPVTGPADPPFAQASATRSGYRAGMTRTSANATAKPNASTGSSTTTSRNTRSRTSRHSGPPKLFVLDTNVLMHDPTSLFRFEEHDVFLPMITLEELDGHKKGMSEVARSVRQVSRELDALARFVSEDGGVATAIDPAAGLPLNKTGHREARGKLFFQTQLLDIKLPAGLPQGKADNQILGVVQSLRDSQPGREVVLVSKDINMRVKARALGLPAEDYTNDKTLEDGDLLYTGVQALPADFWDKNGQTVESWQQGLHTYYRVSGPVVPTLLMNQFVYYEQPGAPSLYARVTEITGKTAVLKTLRDFSQLAAGPRVRLHHLDRYSRHGQDADDTGRRPEPGTGRSSLQRNHRHPRDRTRGRRHWLLAWERRRKDGPVDGRAGRQPGSAGAHRQRCR
jgi:PhoH-like ATPase